MVNRSDIAIYLKCVWCQRDGIEPRIEVGFTTDGNLQLWCIIHDAAIGPPFELKFPPLVAHLTCQNCRETEKRTQEHGHSGHEHSNEQIYSNDHGHEHGHEKQS